MRRWSMPSSEAETGFWTVARTARPKRVRVSRMNRSPRMTMEIAKANTLTSDTR